MHLGSAYLSSLISPGGVAESSQPQLLWSLLEALGLDSVAEK